MSTVLKVILSIVIIFIYSFICILHIKVYYDIIHLINNFTYDHFISIYKFLIQLIY